MARTNILQIERERRKELDRVLGMLFRSADDSQGGSRERN